MSDPNQTVFISYRRDVSYYVALAVSKALKARGLDVFFDLDNIDSGAFDSILLNQIAARAHFLLILSPNSLERCVEPDDWLRREIECAISLQRNIVPLMVNNFSFRGTEEFLPGQLAQLPRYNGLQMPQGYFDEAIEKLCTRYFKQPVMGEIKPTTTQEQRIVKQKIEKFAEEPTPTKNELSAEEYFGRAYAKQESGDLDGAITEYDQAITLNHRYVKAYYNRGLLRFNKGDMKGAIDDYTEALFLKRDYAKAYNNRGLAHQATGDIENAIADFTEAIKLKSGYTIAHINRGNAFKQAGDIRAAVADYETYLDLKGGEASTEYETLKHVIEELKRTLPQPKQPAKKGTNFLRQLFSRTSDMPETSKDTHSPKTISPPNAQLDGPTSPILHSLLSSAPDGATHQLEPERAILSGSPLHFSFALATDPGLVRSTNQDAIYGFLAVSSDANRSTFGIFIVADGVGHEGRQASELAVQTVAMTIHEDIYRHQAFGRNEETTPLSEILISTVQKANTEVISRMPDSGTTITAAVIIGNIVHIAHVGDTRIYIITKEGVEQITRDHSLVGRLIELGHITPIDAKDHTQRNVLYRAIGQSEDLEVDTLTRQLPPNSNLLLCSDGLWSLLDEAEIQQIVLNDDSQTATQRLIAAANMRGGTDNISVIIVQMQ